jgi:hypothetical protein
MVEHLSQLIVAPEGAVQVVAASGDLGRPFCDCNQTHAAQVLTELGCRPELVFASEASARRSLVVFRVLSDQLQRLAELDHETLATVNQRIRVGTISLPHDEKHYSELYGRVVTIARTAVEMKQSLFARVEYIDSHTRN